MAEAEYSPPMIGEVETKDEEEFHYTKTQLNLLRRVLDKTDEEEIKQSLIVFEQVVELFTIHVPSMKPYSRIDWSLPAAINPEWYGDKLSDRLQNTMLVSALLLTVTAANFLSPPDSLDKGDTAFRVFIYINGICNLMYMLSIVYGIYFIENAMSRTYGESERLILICKFYAYKDLCQFSMGIGALLFPITLAVPMWSIFKDVDAYVMLSFTIIYVLTVVYVIGRSTTHANTEMSRRTSMMSELCDEQGHLLPEYFPKDQGITLHDIKFMLNWAGKDEFKSMNYGLGLTNKKDEK